MASELHPPHPPSPTPHPPPDVQVLKSQTRLLAVCSGWQHVAGSLISGSSVRFLPRDFVIAVCPPPCAVQWTSWTGWPVCVGWRDESSEEDAHCVGHSANCAAAPLFPLNLHVGFSQFRLQVLLQKVQSSGSLRCRSHQPQGASSHLASRH